MVEAPYAVIIPQETVNDENVRIVAWLFASGATVVKDQPICEIETSKTVIEMQAPVDGVLDYQYPAGSDVAVGSILCTIMPASAAASNGNAPHRIPPAEANLTPTGAAAVDSGAAPAAEDLRSPASRMTPSARRVAAQHRIELGAFPIGSLIRKIDVLRMAGVSVEMGTLPPSTPRQKRQNNGRAKEPPATATAAGVLVDWESLSRKKVIEGKILAAGREQTVQSAVSTRVRAPMLRARVNELNASSVAFDALILFEASRLLRRYPQLNAVHENGRIGRYRQVNFCWAIDSGNNLVAPVVKDCDRKTFDEIVAIMEGQVERYLENSLAIEELTGGTFTLSDLSSDGICFFNPLISQGQSAILGISSDATADGDEHFYLTLAFDHQLTEGRTAALFLRELTFRLEAQNRVQELARDNLPALNDSGAQMGAIVPTADSPGTSTAAYCVICQRDYALLQRSRAMLLKSEIPPGLVCSLCVSGF